MKTAHALNLVYVSMTVDDDGNLTTEQVVTVQPPPVWSLMDAASQLWNQLPEDIRDALFVADSIDP